jgi:transcriptional regulator GlxA family with amidase domain
MRDRGTALRKPQTGPATALSVAFVLLPNFTLTPFSALVDILRLAADEGDRSRPIRCRWTILAPTLRPITASCGIQVLPWDTFGNVEHYDYIVVIGGVLHRGSGCDPATIEFLRQADKTGARIAGVCTGSFALIEAGLLNGRRCCVSWYHYPDLMDRMADVIPVADQLFVQDGRYITCAGGVAALDLGAWMIERHVGHAEAQKSLHIMVADKARPAAGAQPQPALIGAVRDERARRVMLLVEQNLSSPLSVTELASSVGLSKRQLERIFRRESGMSVQEFSRQFRIHYGLWLLAKREETVTSIAAECGFADTSHFTRLFTARFGRSPSDMRAQDPHLVTTVIDEWRQRVAR